MKSLSCRKIGNVVALIMFTFPGLFSEGTAYRPVCKVDSTIVQLTLDPDTNKYVVVNSGHSRRRTNELLEATPNLRGGLSLQEDILFGEVLKDSEWIPGYHVDGTSTRALTEEATNSSNSVFARYCSCESFGPVRYGDIPREPVYCPLVVDHCGAPRGQSMESDPLACIAISTNRDFAKTTLWIALTWLCFIVNWLIFSTPGRHLLHYALSFCIPGWNILVAKWLDHSDPNLVRHMIRRNIYHRRQLLLAGGLGQTMPSELMLEAQAVARLTQRQEETVEDDQGIQDDEKERKPTSLALKTRVYKSEPQKSSSTMSHMIIFDPSNNEEEDEETSCIICYQPLEDGQRVGDLVCSHIFHVNCLKTWCKRRNVCPLCQSSDIAKPRLEPVGDADKQRSTMRSDSHSGNQEQSEDPTEEQQPIDTHGST
jgi:hypothetical protein